MAADTAMHSPDLWPKMMDLTFMQKYIQPNSSCCFYHFYIRGNMRRLGGRMEGICGECTAVGK